MIREIYYECKVKPFGWIQMEEVPAVLLHERDGEQVGGGTGVG